VEFPLERQSRLRVADERTRCQDQQSSGTAFDKALKTAPSAGRDFSELGCRIDLKIQENEREIGVTQEKIRSLEGLLGIAATNPQQPPQHVSIHGRWIKTILSIDQRDPLARFISLAQQRKNNQSAPRTGTDHFNNLTLGQTTFEQIVYLREAGRAASMRFC